MNIIISIGFLRGAALMSTSEQVNFIRDIKNTLDLALAGLERQMVQQGACTGYWEGEEEPSYTCTTAVLEPIPADKMEVLKERLSMLAVRYGQDAIALTVAEPQFVDQSAYHSMYAVQPTPAIGEIEYETVRSAVEPLLERLYGEHGDAALSMIETLVNGQMRDYLFMKE
jgi:hypothetical protein